MSVDRRSKRRVDVVILTAIPLEYDEAKKVEAGAWEGSQWEEAAGPNGLPVAFRTFRSKGGRPLRVALALAGNMGAVAATNALLPLVEAWNPQCVAMCGVCAGRPGKTGLGDVIAAERLFFHDTGKRLPDGVQQDLETYKLRDDWKRAIERFDFAARFREQEWWKRRPVPYEWQENWVLAQLRAEVAAPSSLPDCNEHCPQWNKVIESLWKSGDVEDGTLNLSDQGRKRIDRLLIKHRNRLPDTSPTGEVLPFKVHVVPMGSGNQVIEDENFWGVISEYVRKVLSLDMEAAALGALVHARRDRKLDALVMKGVMDFANHGRDDHFKEFAARASAECLIAFLREHLDIEVVPGIDDLLVPGTESKLPENAPPSALLNARYEVVPFHKRGREAILAELERWCAEGPSVAVRLLYAEGGVGKTRLAIELIHHYREMNWAAGFLPKAVPEDWFERLWMLGQPVLVVLDYAESRSDLRAALLRVHRYAQQEDAGVVRRMRILLLARNDGDWWQSLRQSDTALGAWLDTTPARELVPLAMSDVEREEVFNEAAERFAKKRGKEYARRPPPRLSDERFNRVLYLHMAALASVEGFNFEANTLMDVILDHEEHFWGIRAQQADVILSRMKSLARQIVAAATIWGGFADVETTSSLAERLLGRALSVDEGDLLRLLHRIYQRTNEDPAAFLPALEPDLLGEGMVLRIALPKLQEDVLPPDWIDRVLPADAEAHAVSSALEVLGRSSAMQSDVLRPWIERLLAGPLLRSRAVLALTAAKAIGLHTASSVLGEILARLLEEDGDTAVARELDAAGIPHPSVSLCRIDTWIMHVLLQTLPESQEEQILAERARLLSNLGYRLREMGLRQEAFQASRESFEIRHTLAQFKPDVFLPDLAMSLSNLGTMLGDLGQREEALQVTYDAVKIYRSLAQRHLDAFLPDLAMCLNNLGTCLSDLGRHEEAFQSSHEAVELYRSLAQRNPDTFLPALANSLNNLGTTLGRLGQHEEDLRVTQEAIKLYRFLAQRNPDAFWPALAHSLNSLGGVLSALGWSEKAFQATHEAVELYRPLAQRNPDAFQPILATSLNNKSRSLSVLGRHEEALTIAEEAVNKIWPFFERLPPAFEQNTRILLTNLRKIHEFLQRPLPAIVQARLDTFERLSRKAKEPG